MKVFKKALSVVLACTMAMSCAVCFSGCSDSRDSTKIRIGGIGPLTGPAAIYGNAVKNAAALAVEEVNKLDPSIQLELKFEDDESDPEKSVNAYNALKDWGVQLMMGTVTSNPCIAVSAETNNDRIFQLTPSASSTDVIGGQPNSKGKIRIKRKDNVFQMCFTDPNQGSASAEYIANQKLGTKIAVIYNNSDPYSAGIYKKFKAEADEKKLNIVSVTTFTKDSANDFTSQLNAAKSAGADLIFLPIYYTPASLILSQAAKMKYQPKFFGVDGLDGILGIENFDTKLAEGVMLLTPFSADATDTLTKNFVTNYRERFGDVPNQFAADAYDCIYVFYKAIKEKGITADMDAEEICRIMIDALTDDDFKYSGLTGENITWSKTGEVSKDPKGMIIKNGTYVGM